MVEIKNDIVNIIKYYLKLDNYIISLSTSEGIRYEEIEKINIKNNYLWSRVNFINKQLILIKRLKNEAKGQFKSESLHNSYKKIFYKINNDL